MLDRGKMIEDGNRAGEAEPDVLGRVINPILFGVTQTMFLNLSKKWAKDLVFFDGKLDLFGVTQTIFC